MMKGEIIMIRNDLIKKLSIGIASLALVCPLALDATQSVNAKSHKSATVKVVKPIRKHLIRYGNNNMGDRHYPVPYAKRVAWAISYDKKVLNTKRSHYYLGIQSNLRKNEKIMKTLKATYHANVPSQKNGQVQTVYSLKEPMTIGYRNSIRQTNYLNHNFNGDISMDKAILRHHKSGKAASVAIKNLAWARKGVKAGNKAYQTYDHSFKAANSNRIVAPTRLSVYKNYPVRVALNKGIYVNLTRIEAPESNNKVVKAVHLNRNTLVNVKWSSKGYILSNQKLLPSQKGCIWIY